jgi:site-specific DNA-methyltransferase (adenine-specific)
MDSPEEKAENMLYYGDNLEILRRYVKDETIDLVYLDPPFKSQQDYNVLFAERNGSQSASQIRAFEDTWQWDQAAAVAYEDVVTGGGKIAQAMEALRTLLGPTDMLAYLSMMAPRLMELRRVIKPTGSIYLHCDSTASHYLKLLMDAVFGPDQFRNEIIWRRTGAHGSKRSYGPVHDTILFYSKTNDYFFNSVKRPYMKGHVESRYSEDEKGRMKFTSGGNVLTGAGMTSGESGKLWHGFNPSSKNRHWAVPKFLVDQMPPDFEKFGVLEKLEKLYDAGLIEITPGNEWPVPVRYLRSDDGQPIQDIWAYQPYTEGTVYGTEEGIDQDVAWLGPTDPERLGYPTQKPVGFLIRIISSSCPQKGTVLDPFCGCGSTIEAAQRLERPWIGIDITHLAITLMRVRLKDVFGDVQYKVIGEPVSLPDAQALAQQDPYQFQWWTLGLVGARPIDQKKGADKGIDGRIYFFVERGKAEQIIFSVKAGNVTAAHVRDLHGVIDREKAAIGVLISFNEPTQPMRSEAADAGFYTSKELGNPKYPKIQLLTVEEILNGRRIDCPHSVSSREVNPTFKKAPKAKREPKQKEKQSKLSEHSS